jgi:hypothetical protein
MRRVSTALVMTVASVLMVGCTIETGGGGTDTDTDTGVDHAAILQLTWDMMSSSEQRELCLGWNTSPELQDVMVDAFIDGYNADGSGELSASELEVLVRSLMGSEC